VHKIEQLNQLVDDAEELLIKLADVENPQIRELRERVDQGIRHTKAALLARGEEADGQVVDFAQAVDDYVRDYPWLALGVGMVVAGSLGLVVASTVRFKKSLW
jgi:ElaB/YqjD/DUF883 family membrane-anchored ribosome-binding protein